MFNPVSQAVNRQNLIDLSSLLHGCEWLPFFGTLLGLTRAGDIIPHDDDVDIYANISSRAEIIARLSDSEFKIDLQSEVNSSNWFLQAKRLIGGAESYIDFYFYEPCADLDCVVERWNFSGRWQDESNHMHIPSDLIYPVVSREFFGSEIAMPADPVGCCAYLYGSQWQKPLIKRLGYTTKIVDHVPSIEVNPDQFSEVVRQFYELDELVRKQEHQLGEKWRELIDANQRLVEAGEEIGRWQDRTYDAERARDEAVRLVDEMISTRWWRARAFVVERLSSLKTTFKR